MNKKHLLLSQVTKLDLKPKAGK